MIAASALETNEPLRALAERAAADLGIPLQQVNLLRLAHWLGEKSEVFVEAMRR